ncbi:MAG: hypothetical protein E7L25_03610 [Varibaculum cambriense]|nr:hypothetical protein [Varibaculum cambriense]
MTAGAAPAPRCWQTRKCRQLPHKAGDAKEKTTTKRKDRFVHCRLSEADFERFHEHAEELELAPSEYLRYMIRIPVKACKGGGEIVTLDTKAMSQIYGELVRWGHHYNQAVHALNTIALFASSGGSNTDYFVEQLECANRNLEDVKSGERGIEGKLRQLEGTTLVGGR